MAPGRRGLLLERSSAAAFRRREALALLGGAAAPWLRPARAESALLDESVGFAGQILFLTVKVPALVIGVVRNGETSVHGFGHLAAGSDAEPDGASVFRIGSITKAFAGQVLASLAADGKVGLADPLASHVPEFAQGAGRDRPIRLIDLATHSAGLPRGSARPGCAGRPVPQHHQGRLRGLAEGEPAPLPAGNGGLLFQLRLRPARGRAVSRGGQALPGPPRRARAEAAGASPTRRSRPARIRRRA